MVGNVPLTLAGAHGLTSKHAHARTHAPGRVIRFDSFSKILSSGMRTGLVSGPAALVEQLNLHTQAVNLHPSGISQAVLLKLMQHWGAEGFARQVANVCAFYLGQRDAFLQAADTHLTGLAEWTKPEAGMFSWIKLYGVDDSFQLIGEKAKEEKVLLVPGQVFIPSGGTNQPAHKLPLGPPVGVGARSGRKERAWAWAWAWVHAPMREPAARTLSMPPSPPPAEQHPPHHHPPPPVPHAPCSAPFVLCAATLPFHH